MEIKEEKELGKASKEFGSAIQVFGKKEFEAAHKAFEAIYKKYQESEYYSVLEIQARAKVYMNICSAQLNPVKIELDGDQDHLNEGIFNLNAGNYPRALELFEYLEEKKFQEVFVKYLRGLTHLKNENPDQAYEILEEVIGIDEFYKVIIYNEPDFEELLEGEKWAALVEP